MAENVKKDAQEAQVANEQVETKVNNEQAAENANAQVENKKAKKAPGKAKENLKKCFDSVKKVLPYLAVAAVAAAAGAYCADPKGSTKKIKGKLGLGDKEVSPEPEATEEEVKAEEPQRQQEQARFDNRKYYGNGNNNYQQRRFERAN
jgi:hypothetical protein